jgi:hypothetical protein
MNKNRKARMAYSFTTDAELLAKLCHGGLALMAVVCLFILPTSANAACGIFGAPGVKSSIKLPMVTHADIDRAFPLEAFNQPIVGLWHVIYTNSADSTTFNDTFDTWHSDGTEFESAFLPSAGGNVCVGVWRPTGRHKISLHHVGWLFNPATPTATATNTFTLDEDITVAGDGMSYSGNFTFKIWNLDGSPTPVEVQGTIAATRITPN